MLASSEVHCQYIVRDRVVCYIVGFPQFQETMIDQTINS